MEPETFENGIKDRLSKGKKPKASVPVHIYGMPAKIYEIMEIANKYEIPVIEYAAEAFGSKFNQKLVGSFGEMGVLSFNGSKIVIDERIKKGGKTFSYTKMTL